MLSWARHIISLFFLLFVVLSSVSFATIADLKKWIATEVAVDHAFNIPFSATFHIYEGLSYFLSAKASSKNNINSSGDLSRGSRAVWVNVKDMQGNTKDLTAKLPYSALQSAADKKDSSDNYKYPLTRQRMMTDGTMGALKSTGVDVGQKRRLSDGSIVEITSSTYGFGAFGRTPQEIDNEGSSNIVFGSDSQQRYSTLYVTWVRSVPDPPVAKQKPDAIASLTSTDSAGSDGSSSGGDVKSDALNAELDKMFQDPDYVPTFSDATTGLPYSPPDPSTIATPAQVNQYAAQVERINAADTAAASAQSTATASQSAANNAGQNYANSGGNPATGQGGDPSLYQKYLEALATAARDKALADKYAADAAAARSGTGVNGTGVGGDENVTVPSVPGDNTYQGLTDSDKPEKKSILDLLKSYFTNSPMVNMVKSFVVTTSNSSGVVSVGKFYGRDIRFDFTRWESTFRFCGGMLLVVAHGFAVLVVVRGW